MTALLQVGTWVAKWPLDKALLLAPQFSPPLFEVHPIVVFSQVEANKLAFNKGTNKRCVQPSATRQSILAFTSKDMKQKFCSSAWLSEPLTCRSSNKVIAAKYNVTYVLFFHSTIYSGMNNTLHFQQPNCSNIYKSWVPAGGQESCKQIDLKYCVRCKRLHPKFSDDQSGDNCMIRFAHGLNCKNDARVVYSISPNNERNQRLS